MTIQFALDYIPRRMRELGHGNRYVTRFHHFMFKPSETRSFESYAGEIYLLIDPLPMIRVTSELGLYLISDFDGETNEQQYEHQGDIEVVNLDGEYNQVKFIQVVPLHKEIED